MCEQEDAIQTTRRDSKIPFLIKISSKKDPQVIRGQGLSTPNFFLIKKKIITGKTYPKRLIIYLPKSIEVQKSFYL